MLPLDKQPEVKDCYLSLYNSVLKAVLSQQCAVLKTTRMNLWALDLQQLEVYLHRIPGK